MLSEGSATKPHALVGRDIGLNVVRQRRKACASVGGKLAKRLSKALRVSKIANSEAVACRLRGVCLREADKPRLVRLEGLEHARALQPCGAHRADPALCCADAFPRQLRFPQAVHLFMQVEQQMRAVADQQTALALHSHAGMP